MDPVTKQSPLVAVKASPHLKNKGRVNIEIREGKWYILPDTILCVPVKSFHEHSRRQDIILQGYGEKLDNDEIKIIKDYRVPNALCAWRLVQGNDDSVPRFQYKIVKAVIEEKVPKFDPDQTGTNVDDETVIDINVDGMLYYFYY